VPIDPEIAKKMKNEKISKIPVYFGRLIVRKFIENLCIWFKIDFSEKALAVKSYL